ncbi:MAG: endonuclease/exonuclease/phosphatase family protein [Acidimicrobiales bacterium]
MHRTGHNLLRTLRLVPPGLSWAAVAALAVVTVFHLSHREPLTLIVGLIAATPWIYMLAWVTASIGLFSRRPALVATSLVLVGLQLWWVVPDFDPISHLSPRVPGDVSLRLFDANVSQSNRNLDEIAGEIRRDKPQVVTMEELTFLGLRSLNETGAMTNYAYKLVRPAYGSYGMALWSVFPLAGATEWLAVGHPELRTWLELPGGRHLRIDVLHTTAPVGKGEPWGWSDQLEAIYAELSHEPRPLVVVGDLNATWYDWHFQALLGLGLRDAAVVAGRGWQMTWPRDQAPVVPYLRIDHVLLSSSVSLQSYSLGDGEGSDHHPLLVQIVLGLTKGRDRHGVT